MAAAPAQPLIIVKPVPLTDARLVSTNVPEADQPAWLVGTSYVLGALAMSAHVVWKSKQASNVGHDPATSPDWWEKVSATNRWKAFDTSTSSQTSQASSITYRLRPGQAVNAVAFLNLQANSVRVYVDDPTDGVVYDQTRNLLTPITSSSLYAYLFEPVRRDTKALFLDLPTYGTADVCIEITGTGAVACGVIAMGYQTVFSAGINVGSRFKLLDGSKYTTDASGVNDLVRGNSGGQAIVQIDLTREMADPVYDYMRDILGTPCLFICHQPIRALSMFGIVRENEISADDPRYRLNLTILGLT